MSEEEENQPDDKRGCLSITDLPEEILEQIIINLSPYNDLRAAREVCKQWHRLVGGVTRQIHQTFQKSVREASVVWHPVRQNAGPSIAERYSHCACYNDKSLYVFGGCTSTSTTFNDLWRFDLATRQWIRPLAMGTYPSPKACASMVVYKEELVLFGGWNHPSPYPLHQAPRFFNELHTYSLETNRWSHLFPQTSPRPCAGHSACVVQDKMVVFGGCNSPGVGCNDTWVYDFVQKNWERQNTTLPQPVPRYGQSQLAVDESHILIIGGCGGPNQIFNDIWLLSLTGSMWTWSEVTVNSPDLSPSQLWSHPACKVGDCAVVLSRTNKVINSPPSKSPAVSERLISCNRLRIRAERVWVPPREESLPPALETQDDPNHSDTNSEDPEPQPGPSGLGTAGKERSYALNGNNSGLGIGNKRKLSVLAQATAAAQARNQDSSSDENTDCFTAPLARNLRSCHSKTTARFASASTSQPLDQPTAGTSQELDSSVAGPLELLGSPSARESSRQQARRFCGLATDSSSSPSGVPGIRPGLPSIRPNAMKNRSKQLDALRRHADRIKQQLGSEHPRLGGRHQENANRPGSIGMARPCFGPREVRPPSPVIKEPKSPMFLHVLDLSHAVCQGEATWQPINEMQLLGAPEETVFYSLVVGRGELLMFGGIQKDLSSMQIGADLDSHVVSNDLYVLSAPKT